ncbi:MAG: hypothetical protein IPL55_19940 [Saprospiraceae bacterium]|jgi:WD40 repeat protein|nr:hypothetical protein [Saprospiraceae bacterium]
MSLPVSVQIKKINEFSGHNGAIYGLVCDPNNNVFYSVAGDGWIVRWPISATECDGTLIGDSSTKLFCIAFGEASQLLVAGDINGFLYWIDPVENKILSKSSYHKGSIFDLCFISATKLVSVSADGYVCLWDIQSRLPVISFRISFHGLRCIKHDKLEKKLYIGASDNHIYILDDDTFDVINIIKNAHGSSVFSIENLTSELWVSGGRDALLKFWDKKDKMLKESISAHWSTINKIIALPEISAFATASRDKSLRIWDTATFELLKNVDLQKGGHLHSVNTLLWIPESHYLISAGDDRTIKLFSISHLG